MKLEHCGRYLDDLKLYDKDITTIISFETIEHTPKPFDIIKKFYNILPTGGRLILSFPNAQNETLDKNGKSLDPFHLSVIKYPEMLDNIKEIGFKINHILGQSLINQIITHAMKIEKDLNINLDNLYNYQKKTTSYLKANFWHIPTKLTYKTATLLFLT